MKKALLLLVFILSFSASHGQISDVIADLDEASYSSDYVTQRTGTEKIYLLGNASYKSDRLTIYNADKIVFDKRSQTLFAYGVTKFQINGKVNYKSTKAVKSITLEYKMGDSIVYSNYHLIR